MSTRRRGASAGRAALNWLVTLVLLAGRLASAQNPATGPAEDGEPIDDEGSRRYTVEFIIFEYTAAAGGTSEIFLPDELPPDLTRGSVEAENPGELPETALPPEFELPAALVPDEPLEEIRIRQQVEMLPLEPEDYTLTGIYNKLVQLDAYRPVMHGGWTQATAERDVAPPIRLRALGEPPLRLDGSLTLYLGRFLHLVVDLTLDDDLPRAVSPRDSRVPSYGDNRSGFGYDDLDVRRQPIRYRISEDRIVKNGDLRYFDHPKFGVLAKVTRHEADTADQENPAALPADPSASR